MFKRCHGLKKSNLKIKCNPQTIFTSRSSKSIQSTEEDQDCPMTQSAYTSSCPKVKLIKSYEIENPYPPATPLVGLQQKNILNREKSMLEKIKTICKSIEEVENKIEGYQQISKRMEVRHFKEMNQKVEDKEKKLSLLIELFQLEKNRGESLTHQLLNMGMRESNDLEQKETSWNRRTTATWNNQ